MVYTVRAVLKWGPLDSLLHFKGIGLSVLLGIILWIRSEQIVSMTVMRPIKSFPLHYVGTTFSESSTRKPLWRTQLIDPKPAIIAPRQYNFSPIKGEEDMEELAIAMPRRPLKLDKLISRFPHVRSGETDLFELEAWKSWASSSCLVSPSGGEASELASCGIANATGWSSL
ncbi:hypothetical protein NC652_034138 [Populus alba x Populus x berolinensis]|nr:hypothetical protein NC652_034138 [Populus alba x Populus x berolinensis]